MARSTTALLSSFALLTSFAHGAGKPEAVKTPLLDAHAVRLSEIVWRESASKAQPISEISTPEDVCVAFGFKTTLGFVDDGVEGTYPLLLANGTIDGFEKSTALSEVYCTSEKPSNANPRGFYANKTRLSTGDIRISEPYVLPSVTTIDAGKTTSDFYLFGPGTDKDGLCILFGYPKAVSIINNNRYETDIIRQRSFVVNAKGHIDSMYYYTDRVMSDAYVAEVVCATK
jgi:hypothetical protein